MAIYTLLVYAALVGASEFAKNAPSFIRGIGVVLVLLIMLVAISLLASLHRSIKVRRARLEAIRAKLSAEFRAALGVLWKRKGTT